MEETMREHFANLAVMDHLNDCIRKAKAKGAFDKNECLQTICEALMVILENQEEILSKIEMGVELKK